MIADRQDLAHGKEFLCAIISILQADGVIGWGEGTKMVEVGAIIASRCIIENKTIKELTRKWSDKTPLIKNNIPINS